MDQDSDQVELHGGGWKGIIGYAPEYYCSAPYKIHVGAASICWERIELEEFFLSQAAALLITQGRLIQDFFPPDVYFVHRPSGSSVSRGPYFYLKGVLSKPHDPPLRLKGVVLASVLEAPPDMKMEELRGRLLTAVL